MDIFFSSLTKSPMTILYSFVFEQSWAIDHVNDSIFCQNAICHGIIPLCRAGQHFIGQTRLPLLHVFDYSYTIYWTRWPQSQFRVVQATSQEIFYLFRRLMLRWLNWNSLKGDKSKAVPNRMVYFQSPKGACTNHVDKWGGRGGCSDDHNT